MPKKYTANQIIEKFSKLRLDVTNDENKIIKSAAPLKSFYSRKKNSPDPKDRYEAEEWFKNLTDLQNSAERGKLISIVEEHFWHLVEMTLMDSVQKSNINEITQELYEKLKLLAENECKFDSLLTKQILDKFKIRYDPKQVANLSAISDLGEIRLSWTFPPEKCDEIFIKRFDAYSEQKTKQKPKVLCQGKLSSYTDKDVKAGQSYRYEIFSQYKNVESKTGVSTTVIAVGEISELKGQWVKDHIELSWKKPGTNCKVYIYRAYAPINPIKLQPEIAEPFPHNPEAELVYQGVGAKFQDQKVEPNKAYHYLVIANFDKGYYSNGITFSIHTPVPPPNVTRAAAKYVNGLVDIRWDTVKSREPVSYVVVRTLGIISAASPGEGEKIIETSKNYCQDKKVENGKQYTYTIFVCRSGVYSEKGYSTEPVIITEDVKNLNIQAGDSSVTLSWEKPAEAAKVVVCRSLNRINQPGESALVAVTGPNSASDTNLKNDHEYHYLVYCTYLLEKGGEAASAGIQKTVVPRSLPGVISDFKVTKQGNQVVCDWELEGPGTVVIMRTKQPQSYKIGALLKDQELFALGKKIPNTKSNQAIDIKPTPAEPYYTAFVKAGSNVRAGSCEQCIVCEDVSNLKLVAEIDGVRLRWDWPEQCKSVAVVRRQDDWPAGLDDPQGQRFDFTHVEYESNRNSFLDKLTSSGTFYYIVYAQPAEATERIYSSGLTPGCRASIELKEFGQFRYSLKLERKVKLFGILGLLLEWKFDKIPDQFSGFELIANPDRAPSEKNEGVTLYNWMSDSNKKPSLKRKKVWIKLEDSHLKYLGNRFYCRIFLVEPGEQNHIMVIHPDLNHPFEIS